MQFKTDIDGVKRKAAELPSELASLDGIEREMHFLYGERDGKFTLDVAMRDAILAELDRVSEIQNTKRENAALKDKARRRLVVDAIKASLTEEGVAPKDLEAATYQFLGTHEIAVKETDDGKIEIRVLGERGVTDVALAAVNFASLARVTEAFHATVANGPFSTALSRILN